MEDVLFSRSNLTIQLPWSDFLKKSIYKAFGPSLALNQMWTKRNDHAPKSECADFLIYVQKTSLKFKLQLFFCFLLSSSSLPPKNPLKFYYNIISLPWALAIFYQSTSFASPTTKPVGLCQWIM